VSNPTQFAPAPKAGNARIGFFIHLAVFIAVNTLLVYINLTTSTDRLWFKWPLLGWGVGLFFHALAAFLFAPKAASKKGWAGR
jgi:hypothetical protein